MDFSHYKDLPVRMAVDLVNTREVVSGKDTLQDVDGLVAYLDSYDRDWSAEGWYSERPRPEDVQQVIAIREQLRNVFTAPDEAEAARVLNEILAQTWATPRVSVHGEGAHLHFEPADGSLADWLGTSLAMGLAVVIADHGFDRFGTCGADDCQDVFVDTSKNRSRSRCSTSCTTRSNVAAYRERQRSAAG